MTKILYKDWKPKPESTVLVAHAESIIKEYLNDGYTLTLRQLYYQFVARGLIENSERSYKNIGTLITKARMAGLISWEAIEDRNREHHDFWTQENPLRVIKSMPMHIRFDYWDRQPYYVEVWVEKEALGNVISRACQPLLVPHMSCKGYLSASEAWRAGQRFGDKINRGHRCVLIHLGDHDPSGIDMTRDNDERLQIFTNSHDVDVIRIALNKDQVDEFNPPPNPAKITDSRAKGYIKRFGRTSWELDALEPQFMSDLITNHINNYIDQDLWAQVREQQREVEDSLRGVYQHWDVIKENLDEGVWD